VKTAFVKKLGADYIQGILNTFVVAKIIFSLLYKMESTKVLRILRRTFRHTKNRRKAVYNYKEMYYFAFC